MAMISVINNQACQKLFSFMCRHNSMWGSLRHEEPPGAQTNQPPGAASFFCYKSFAILIACLLYVLYLSASSIFSVPKLNLKRKAKGYLFLKINLYLVLQEETSSPPS